MAVAGEASKAALVTGGAQGIGRAIAERLLGDGWRVAVLDSDAEALEAAAPGLRGRGEVLLIAGDVAREGDIARAVAGTADAFGRLDGLVNNAGIGLRKPLAELSLAEWRRVIDVNLTGAFLCARATAALLAVAGGAIVNIASTRALMSEPGSEAYAASKGGLVALTHALALSLGPQVRVNCISPGWIDVSGRGKPGAPARTPPPGPADHAQHPAGRVGVPEDIAALAAWLLGPEAGFATGANFVADGGMTRKMIYF